MVSPAHDRRMASQIGESMSQPHNDHEERDESLPPLEVLDVRLRLERGEPGKDSRK